LPREGTIGVFTWKSQRTHEEFYADYIVFRRCANALIGAREKELRKVGATTAKAAVLHAIAHFGGTATPGEIARWLVLEPHSVVGTVSRMERDGMVNRVRGSNTHDRRITYITLTKEGQVLWKKIKDSRELITRLFSSLSEESLELFRKQLELLRALALEHG